MFVQAVAPPFGVDIDTSVPPAGDTLRFTSDVSRSLEWVFLPGDTAADPLVPASLEYEAPRIKACALKSSCRYAPQSSGRMYVHGRMENGSVGWGVGPVVTAGQEPRVILECIGDRGADAVTRGKEIVCNARKDPAEAAGQLVVLQWAFQGRARVDGELTSLTWQGTMAEGGEVTLRAQIGARAPVVERARITVASRNWTDHLPPARVERVSCAVRTPICPQTRMVEERDAGLTYIPSAEVDVSRFRVERIVEGPNAGWWYVAGDEPPVRLPNPVTRFNPGIFDSRNALYRSSGNCRPEDVQYWIAMHESTHMAIGQERAAAGYINGQLEGRAAYRPIDDRQFYARTVEVLQSRLQNLLDRNHNLSSRYPAAPCDLPLRANSVN